MAKWTSRLSLLTVSYFKINCHSLLPHSGSWECDHSHSIKISGVDNELTAEWRGHGNILPRFLQTLILFEKERTKRDRQAGGKGERKRGKYRHLTAGPAAVRGYALWGNGLLELRFLEAQGQFQGTWAVMALSVMELHFAEAKSEEPERHRAYRISLRGNHGNPMKYWCEFTGIMA